MYDPEKDLFSQDMTDLNEEEDSEDGLETSMAQEKNQKYVIRRAPAELSSRQDAIISKVDEQTKKAELPIALTVVMYITSAIAAMILLITLSVFLEREITISTMYKNAGFFLWPIMLISAAVALGIYLKKRSLAREYAEDPAVKELMDASERILKETLDALSIPECAIDTDLLIYAYKVDKNGKKKDCSPLLSHINASGYAFRENDCLCIGDLTSVYAFPLSEITAIRRLDRKISQSLYQWTKAEAPLSKELKQYKLRVDNGIIYSKYCYCLELCHEGEQEYILFPCYEIGTLTALTGLSPIDEQE
ncbi:MAG: hypothetical protein IJY04_02555 [Clostridia bacterium]|nr:hypothetical protein [Clostridia bacterium]